MSNETVTSDKIARGKIAREEIVRQTGQDGGVWAQNHVKRLAMLVDEICGGMKYDRDVMWYSLHLHDWGAYGRHFRQGVDHALRSRQVAEEVLPATDLAMDKMNAVLYAIEYHDYRDERQVSTPEAMLLRDADFLDFIGVTGLARAFSSNPRDLAKGLATAIARRDAVISRISLPRAKILAEKRLASMNQFLSLLQEESYGLL